jgi:hypothetical protein
MASETMHWSTMDADYASDDDDQKISPSLSTGHGLDVSLDEDNCKMTARDADH